MTESRWRLLGMYLVILDYDLKAGGQRQTNYSRAISGILETVLGDHEDEIQERFHVIKNEVEKRRLAGFFDADQLDAIEHASAAEIPEVYRQNPIPQRGTLSQRARALLGAAGKPRRPVPGPAGES